MKTEEENVPVDCMHNQHVKVNISTTLRDHLKPQNQGAMSY